MASGNGGGDKRDLTLAVRTAKRGFRRDVEVLVHLLDSATLYIPLSKAVPGAEEGQELEVDEGFRLSPHMLVDEDGKVYAALFTKPDLLEPLIEELEWQTDGEPLSFATVPARVALEMALDVIDDEQVFGLILNAMDETELVLRRHELGSILQGKPLPLVGYVQDIPEQDFEETLVATPDEEPPRQLVETIESCLAEFKGISGYKLNSTFNAERDIEPHLTLTITTTRPSADYATIAKRLVAAISDMLPPPGYIDVLFDNSD